MPFCDCWQLENRFHPSSPWKTCKSCVLELEIKFVGKIGLLLKLEYLYYGAQANEL